MSGWKARTKPSKSETGPNPPPFRVKITGLASTMSLSTVPKTTYQLHKERMEASEFLVGSSMSNASKTFIGTTSSKIWSPSEQDWLSSGPDAKVKVHMRKGAVLDLEPKESGPVTSRIGRSASLGPSSFSKPSRTKSIPADLKVKRKPRLKTTRTEILIPANEVRKKVNPNIDLDLGGGPKKGVSKLKVKKSQFLEAGPRASLIRDSREVDKLLEQTSFSNVIKKSAKFPPLRQVSPGPLPTSRRHLQKKAVKSSQGVQDLMIVRGYPHLAADGTRNRGNTFAMPKETKKASGDVDGQKKPAQEFQVEVDMEGFEDDEIFFQTDDTSLVIIGLRHKTDHHNARKITEVVEFPDGIYPEALRIARDSKGTLSIEQC